VINTEGGYVKIDITGVTDSYKQQTGKDPEKDKDDYIKWLEYTLRIAIETLIEMDRDESILAQYEKFLEEENGRKAH
jgi:hypothetical protein